MEQNRCRQIELGRQSNRILRHTHTILPYVLIEWAWMGNLIPAWGCSGGAGRQQRVAEVGRARAGHLIRVGGCCLECVEPIKLAWNWILLSLWIPFCGIINHRKGLPAHLSRIRRIFSILCKAILTIFIVNWWFIEPTTRSRGCCMCSLLCVYCEPQQPRINMYSVFGCRPKNSVTYRIPALVTWMPSPRWTGEQSTLQ